MVRLCLILSSIECGFFLIYPICRSYSFSVLVSSRGNYSICSCRLGVFKGRDEFRMLLSCCFEPSQQLQFNLMNIHIRYLLCSRHYRKFFKSGEAPMPMDQNRIQTIVCAI